MALKKISEFPKVTPSTTDKILIEKNGEGGHINLSEMPVSTPVNDRITEEVTELSGRISDLAKVPAGSTKGDLELMDIRRPATGFTVPANANAGDAVRAQVTQLDGKITELKGDIDKSIVDISDDVKQLVEYKQVEQEYRMSGSLVTDNWDSVGVGGYYDANGKFTPNASYRYARISSRRKAYKLFVTNQNPVVLYIHVFNGEPSEQTFVKRYTESDCPRESNPLIVEPNQIVVVQNTPSTSVVLKADTKIEYENKGVILDVIATAEQANTKAEQANTKAEQANTKAEQAVEIAGSIEPIVDRTKALQITKSMMQFIGNKYPSGTGALFDHDGYWGYTYVIPEDGEFYIKNLGNSSFGFLAIYNGSVADGNLAMDREEGNTFATRNLAKGQIVFISYALTTTDESAVQGGNITHTYHYTERPTMFMRGMKVAWFGDSISQLQLLPHRVAEYMGITVNDCSFAGANLSVAGTTDSMSLLELSKMIISKNFTRLEDYLTAQANKGIDITEKRKNANTFESLDFDEITDVVTMIGTNDLNNDYVTTTSSLEVFKQSMRTIIDNFNNNYPHINLYFISNPYRGDITPTKPDKHGHSLIDIINAEKEVCEEYNIPYYDLYHNSGINANTIGYYLSNDLLHQNENGDILLAQKCAKWLMAN